MKDLAVIADGALLIDGGALARVGTSRQVENAAETRGAREINAAGRVVMPGFIDCHTHLAFPPPDAPEEDREAAARALAADTTGRAAARWLAYLTLMARHGATTVEIKTGGLPGQAAERKLLRALAILENEPIDVVRTFLFRLPPEDGPDAPQIGEYVNAVVTGLLPKIRRRNLAQFADVAWDGRREHRPCFERFLESARAAAFPCKVHAAGANPGAAAALGVRHLAMSVDHLEQAAGPEAAVLADSATMATVLPCASFHGGLGNAPARALIDAGVAVALGTDFHPRHCPTFSMQAAVSLACLRLGMAPEEAISAATINAAHALGCAAVRGSLETGKQADILILDISDYRDLAHYSGGNLVNATIKRGEMIYQEGGITAARVRNKLALAPLVLH